MLVAVMACPREKPNAFDTVASMRAHDHVGGSEVLIVVDSLTSLGPSCEVQTMLSPEEAAAQDRRTARARSMITYARCLELGADIVVEDDVVFAPRWTAALVAAWVDHPGASLLGYNRFGVEGWHPAGEKLWGSLLMYHPPGVRAALARALREEAELDDLEWGADEVVGRVLADMGVPVWCLSPSLVQHVGDRSVINPDHGRRRAPDFPGGLP